MYDAFIASSQARQPVMIGPFIRKMAPVIVTTAAGGVIDPMGRCRYRAYSI